MCLNHDSHEVKCSGCEECAAVETLLSFSRASGRKMSARRVAPATKRPVPSETLRKPSILRDVVCPPTSVMRDVVCPTPSVLRDVVCPPTPPPSDPGSMSPLQIDDSCESFDMIQHYEPPRKSSRLVQVH